MSNPMDADNILALFIRLKDELPLLVGEQGWIVIGNRLSAGVNHQCWENNADERARSAVVLVELIAPYPHARERFHKELTIQAAVRDEIETRLTESIKDLSLVDKQSVEILSAMTTTALKWTAEVTESNNSASETRVITIKVGGIGGSKSIKLHNLRLDFGEMSQLVAGAMLAGFSAIEKPHPLIIVAGILITVSALTNAITINISERDASVFWGFIQARRKDNSAKESTIVERTNKERGIVGLDALTHDQVKNALYILKSLGCVERIKGKETNWRIVENYRIED